jgi:hypothetical protein
MFGTSVVAAAYMVLASPIGEYPPVVIPFDSLAACEEANAKMGIRGSWAIVTVRQPDQPPALPPIIKRICIKGKE